MGYVSFREGKWNKPALGKVIESFKVPSFSKGSPGQAKNGISGEAKT